MNMLIIHQLLQLIINYRNYFQRLLDFALHYITLCMLISTGIGSLIHSTHPRPHRMLAWRAPVLQLHSSSSSSSSGHGIDQSIAHGVGGWDRLVQAVHDGCLPSTPHFRDWQISALHLQARRYCCTGAFASAAAGRLCTGHGSALWYTAHGGAPGGKRITVRLIIASAMRGRGQLCAKVSPLGRSLLQPGYSPGHETIIK